MSTYGSVDTDWKYHSSYVEPHWDAIDRMNPFMHGNLIREREKAAMLQATSKFSVTKLPRGGTHDHMDYTPMGHKLKTQPKKGRVKKSQAEMEQEAIDIFKKKEAAMVSAPLESNDNAENQE